MQPRRPVTLMQVAERAGVSLTTASKAINARTRVSAATRDRVMAAARELAYTPNPHARSLITGRTSTVGLVMLDSGLHRFAVPVMLGAEEALSQIDLSLITSDARGNDDRCRELAVMLTRRKVDGLIIVGDNNRVTPTVTDLVDVPVVYVNGMSESAGDTCYLPDDRLGGSLIVEHVAGLGRRRIAHLTGPRGTTAVDHRVVGVRAALRDAGLRPYGGIRYGLWSQRWGREAARRLLSDRPDVDTVVCGSDQIAAGVVEAVLASGRHIPDDVAITGYDNWFVFTQEVDPPLTTVDSDFEGLGAAAAQELFGVIDGALTGPGLRTRSPSVVVRGSTVRASTRSPGTAPTFAPGSLRHGA